MPKPGFAGLYAKARLRGAAHPGRASRNRTPKPGFAVLHTQAGLRGTARLAQLSQDDAYTRLSMDLLSALLISLFSLYRRW